MKRILLTILSLIMLFSLIACSEGRVELHPSPSPTVEQTSAATPEPSKGVNRSEDDIVRLPKGQERAKLDAVDMSSCTVISYDYNKYGELMSLDVFAGEGDIFVYPDVLSLAKEHKGERVYLYVQLQINPPEPEFLYKGNTMEYYKSAPALKDYDKAYEAWAESEYYGKLEYSSADPPNMLFKRIWESTASAEEKRKYDLTSDEYTAAMNAREEWKTTEEYGRIKEESMISEAKRLKALGLNIDEASLKAYLTPSQITDFPASDNFGYHINWAIDE